MKRHLLTLVAVLAIAPSARAQDTVPRVFPYEGVLALDGDFVDGDIDMRFTIYDGSDSPLWTEEHSTQAGTSDCSASCSVTFYRGHFSVLLGEYVYLTYTGANDGDWIFDGTSDTAYSLGISVYRDGTWVELAGRQAIAPVPYALWNVAGAAGFDISGVLEADSISTQQNMRYGCDVTLTGNLVSNDQIDVNSLYVESSMVVSGALTADDIRLEGGDLSIASGDLNWRQGSTNRTALRDDDAGTLTINPDGEFDQVVFNDARVDVTGTLTVTGDVNLGDQSLTAGSTTLRGDQTLFQMLSFDMGTSTTADTGVSTSDWHCAVVGIEFGPGNIATSSRSRVGGAFTSKSGGTWRINADWGSEDGENESHEIDVLCMQIGLVGGTWNPSW